MKDPIDVLKEKEQIEKDTMHMIQASNSKCNSTCKKKQLGCILLIKHPREAPIRGTNGPPFPLRVCDTCPRMDSHGGKDLELCRSVHAERQALLIAARHGHCTEGATLYSYMGVPCKDCMLELIQAGVSEIVVSRETYHDELSKSILQEWVRKGGQFRIFEIPSKEAED